MAKAIGLCSFKYHWGDLSWEKINTKGCLRTKCPHFSWISLKDRDSYREKYGYEKKEKQFRVGTVKQRKDKRRILNLHFLELNHMKWEWVDQSCDHILINGHIDYYLGSTRWHDRTTTNTGYKMLYSLNIEYN